MDFRIAVFKDGVSTFRIPHINVNKSFFFKARDVATTLGYADTKRAIQNHVDDDDKKKWKTCLEGLPLSGGTLSPPWTIMTETLYISISLVYLASPLEAINQ